MEGVTIGKILLLSNYMFQGGGAKYVELLLNTGNRFKICGERMGRRRMQQVTNITLSSRRSK